MTRQAVFLEQLETFIDRVVLGQAGRRQQGGEAFGHGRQALDGRHRVGPLLRADVASLRIGPDQVERPGTVLAFPQRRPGLGRVLDRQPGPGPTPVE
ncbi:hypothetical protein D3C76_1119300 [compost metagenome]